MSKRIKDMITIDVVNRIGDARDFLVINASRLDAFSQNTLRLKLRDKKISALTVKNTLAKLALGKLGVNGLNQFLEGPSTLVWGGSDVVALSKEITKWAKDLKQLEIKGGSVEGRSISPTEVESLSKSPGRLELIGMIVGLALSPGANVAAVVLGAGGTLAGQIKSIADKEPEGTVTAA
ncbi:MAG: 50S ribosomal protein L10 [Planctomycetales bacterium]|nr:50S ribosomal protein L10 [Planctomycetales bacterium]